MQSPRIEEIKLDTILPAFFAEKAPASSDIWLKNITLRRGEQIIIEAKSGAGKSSLCAFIYGLRTDYLGSIHFNNLDTKQLTIRGWQALRRRHLAYLPQDLMLFPEVSAIDNIRIKNNLTNAVDEKRILHWMEQLDILSLADKPTGKLSLGQQQRVAIIRTLCQPFDFLLLDEPVSHLDHDNNHAAAEVIDKEAARRGAAIIATSVGNRLMLSKPRIISL